MTLKTANAMTKDLVTVTMSDDLAGAYKKLKALGIRHFPVLNSFDDVVGIISERDFQKATKADISGEVKFEAYALVSDYMTTPIKTVSVDAELISVVEQMIHEKTTAVLVTQNSSLVGIITYEDLLQILADLLRPTENDSVVNTAQSWIYTSPIGDIVRSLSAAGI